jgi:hypothetical protein
MRACCTYLAAIAFAVVPGQPGFADDPAKVAAKELVGLFMQGCLRFAGDPSGLREWAAHLGLTPLATEGQRAFLDGASGVAFDASNQSGKYVLISEDGGSCSTVAETASGAAVIAELEQDLDAAKVGFIATADKVDPEEASLKHREYQASQGRREWSVLVSVVRDSAGGEAMLTAKAK